MISGAGLCWQHVGGVGSTTTTTTTKSSLTLFTPDTHEHHKHSQVRLADQVLPLEKKPKVLGVTLDTHFHATLQQYRSKSAATQ